MVAENVAWVAGIFGGSFPDIRCLGRGTSLGGNGDDDERESVFWGGRRVGKEGVGKDGSTEVITGVCLPCFVDVELGVVLGSGSECQGMSCLSLGCSL